MLADLTKIPAMVGVSSCPKSHGVGSDHPRLCLLDIASCFYKWISKSIAWSISTSHDIRKPDTSSTTLYALYSMGNSCSDDDRSDQNMWSMAELYWGVSLAPRWVIHFITHNLHYHAYYQQHGREP